MTKEYYGYPVCIILAIIVWLQPSYTRTSRGLDKNMIVIQIIKTLGNVNYIINEEIKYLP